MNAPFWNEERLAKLRELWTTPDLSAAAIAREMGTTKGAILGKAHRIGLAESNPKRTRYSPQHKPPITTIPVAGSAAPVRQPPKESGDWRGAPVPVDIDEETVRKLEVSKLPPVPKNGLDLFKLQSHHCRWPLNDGNPWRFCAEPRANAKDPYCEDHCKRAFYEWPPKKKATQ
jgi:GcrA cell cycle regulator